MCQAFRKIMLLLVAVALIGGSTVELARSAHYVSAAIAGMPCDMTMPTSAAGGDEQPMQPCKGVTPDCIDLMGCVVATALPAQFLTHESTVQYRAIVYWTSAPELASLDLEPEPLPPRTV